MPSAQHPRPAVEPPDSARLEIGEILELLARGEVEVVGRLPRASNTTVLAVVRSDGFGIPVVYKPRRGERPLWDFPRGTLCQRETAAFVVSEALGWGVVPPTLMRDDGPLGPGSVQLWAEADENIDVIDLVEAGHAALQPLAVFDAIANNADRKVGHCLVDTDGRLWGIDHGLTFNEGYKLRTVLWHWAGEPVPPTLLDGLGALASRLDSDKDLLRELGQLLSTCEMEALGYRVRQLLTAAVFPEPPARGPALPWPPY